MATAASTQSPPLLTAEEFARRPDSGRPAELVRGRIVPLTSPKPYHGYVCLNAAALIKKFVDERGLGYVLSNDAGVIVARNPDTLRGADVAYYSHAKVPKGALPKDRYLDVVPDLVVEVKSPDDRWTKLLEKVADYLNAGVPTVLVIDPDRANLHVYSADAPVRLLEPHHELALPDLLPDFRAPVARFFE